MHQVAAYLPYLPALTIFLVLKIFGVLISRQKVPIIRTIFSHFVTGLSKSYHGPLSVPYQGT